MTQTIPQEEILIQFIVSMYNFVAVQSSLNAFSMPCFIWFDGHNSPKEKMVLLQQLQGQSTLLLETTTRKESSFSTQSWHLPSYNFHAEASVLASKTIKDTLFHVDVRASNSRQTTPPHPQFQVSTLKVQNRSDLFIFLSCLMGSTPFMCSD